MRVIAFTLCFMYGTCWSQMTIDKKTFKRMPHDENIYVSRYEVTNKQYKAFLQDLKLKGLGKPVYEVQSAGWEKIGFGELGLKYWSDPTYDNYPVVNITHEGAQAYCQWFTDQLNATFIVKIMVARLPSEKEWMLAALGKQDTTQYSPQVNQLQVPPMLPKTRYNAWNTPVNTKKKPIYNANIKYRVSNTGADVSLHIDGYAYTAPITEFQPNDISIYNLIGNVAEMVDQPGVAKGGGWDSFIEDTYLDKKIFFDGADPRVGFRVLVQWLTIDNGWLMMTKERSLRHYREFGSYFGIKSGEVVADVGAGNGWIEGVHMLIPDMRCTFYVQDIDPKVLNEKDFNYMLNHYERLNGSPKDDQYNFVLGDERNTRLPKNTFDRVILNLTYHEMTYREEMLADIKSILKPEGILVIGENMASRPGEKRKDCKHLMPQEKGLMETLTNSGFKLEKKVINPNQKALAIYHFKSI